jgi:hypothetical protein
MQNQINPDFIKSFWEPRFPGQVPSQLAVPAILEGDTLYLAEEELKVIELGHSDTAHTTALYVPSIRMVISGDASITTRIPISPNAMKKPGASGCPRSMRSRRSIRKQR